MRLALAAAAMLALTALPAAPASASPQKTLFLAVSGSQGTWIRGVMLRCTAKPKGFHPHAPEACAALEGVDADLDALRAMPHACTKEYDPVTATASGAWIDRRIDWTKTYSNACELDAATGSVFQF